MVLNMPFADVEFARQAGIKSAQMRAERKRLKIEQDAKDAEQAIVAAGKVLATDDTYQAKRLARVRLQLDRLSDMLDKEQDPRLIDRLTAAIDRLGKHEQFLSGRPGPGTLKPSSKPAKSRRELAPQPLPVVEQTQPKHGPDEPNG